ncbi:MAG: hypothetical protein ACYST6_05145 [Planctomycetota bacterium]|jgi:hypothetical protein
MRNPRNDKKVVEQLADENYSDWISAIRGILQEPGSPLSLKNGVWRVVKRKEMWQELGGMLFDDHLDRFKQIVVEVLKERDPQFELATDERFAASIHGKVLKHSHELRKGLAESLALLGSEADALKNCSRGKAEGIAIVSVREIFKEADWVLWGSLDRLLPTLAEAAPGEFVSAVENGLNQRPCPFDELFSQEGCGVFGGNYMTGLLWALETLAWDEQYLVRTTVLLGRLASRDPGGNWGNRPTNSLATMFLPWLPQTVASVEKRIAAVQTLQKECPESAWKLLLGLLPNEQQSSMGSHKPVWRKIIPDDWEKGVTNEEYWEQVSRYADIAVEMAKGNFARLNELISHLDNLPKPSFDKLLGHLKSAELKDCSEEERTRVWAALVRFTIKHRKYSDADWALGPELVEEIERVAEGLTPEKPENLYRRLFDEGAMELYEDRGDWEEEQKKLERGRQDAIKKIIADGGLELVLEFAQSVRFPEDVGGSLGVVGDDNADSVILPDLLESQDEKLAPLAQGFVWARHCTKGWEWVGGIDTSAWSKPQKGKFLCCLPFSEETWEYSKQLLGEDPVEYWAKVNVNPWQAKESLNLAIDNLIKYGRAKAALNCLYKIVHRQEPLDKNRAVNALLKAVSSEEAAYSVDAYNIVQVIEALQKDPEVNQDDLFNVEWAYLPLLTGPARRGSPKLLEQKLASEPDFFCEAIRRLYRSKNETEPQKEPTEQDKTVAENVWRLLNDWKTVPGTQAGGGFSVDGFKRWLDHVKARCKESGHLDVALSTAGGVLIHYVPDPDGLWIHRGLAEALDAADAEEMRRGFNLGILNSRGVYCVDPTGKPEKELAAKYRQQADEVENATYHRFAITLRSLAKHYEKEAERIIQEHADEESECPAD